MSRRYCAISDCATEPKPGHLMCRQHWLLVPRPERREVVDSWRDVEACQVAMHLHGRLDRYRAAVKAAVDAVMAQHAEAAS